MSLKQLNRSVPPNTLHIIIWPIVNIKILIREALSMVIGCFLPKCILAAACTFRLLLKEPNIFSYISCTDAPNAPHQTLSLQKRKKWLLLVEPWMPKITPPTLQLYSNTRYMAVHGRFNEARPIVGMFFRTVETQHAYLCVHVLYVCVCVCVYPLTSKQKSCPRMLLWTGLMITSSSILRSRASTALLGLSNDSWERDSFSLGIRWDLRVEKGENWVTLPSLSRGSEREGAYVLRVLASVHGECEGRECEDDEEKDAPLASKSASPHHDKLAHYSNTCSCTHF